jgi:hypothetical protein
MFVAVVGASIVTVLLLLAMNEVTGKFRERDGTRYFLVDFIAPIEQGRQRVQRLDVPESAARRLSPAVERSGTTLPVDRPSVTDPTLTPAPAAATPELDAGAVAR